MGTPRVERMKSGSESENENDNLGRGNATLDDGRTWHRHGPIQLEGRIIQPSLFLDTDDRVRAGEKGRRPAPIHSSPR